MRNVTIFIARISFREKRHLVFEVFQLKQKNTDLPNENQLSQKINSLQHAKYNVKRYTNAACNGIEPLQEKGDTAE